MLEATNIIYAYKHGQQHPEQIHGHRPSFRPQQQPWKLWGGNDNWPRMGVISWLWWEETGAEELTCSIGLGLGTINLHTLVLWYLPRVLCLQYCIYIFYVVVIGQWDAAQVEANYYGTYIVDLLSTWGMEVGCRYLRASSATWFWADRPMTNDFLRTRFPAYSGPNKKYQYMSPASIGVAWTSTDRSPPFYSSDYVINCELSR